MSERSARLLLGFGIPAAVLGLSFGPFLAYRSQLPTRVASHFDSSGVADGSMTPTQLASFTGVMMLLGLGACVWLSASKHKLPTAIAPTVAFTGAFIAAMGGAILATTAVAQRGLGNWEDADLDPLVLLTVIGSGVVFGALAALLASRLPSTQEPGTAGPAPRMNLAPGEHAVWTSTLYARWPFVAGLAMLLVSAVLVPLTSRWVTALVFVSAVAAISLARIRVRADGAGLQVRYGFAAWPRTKVPLGRIEEACAIDVRPMQWGGWGYRGSLTLMKRAAVVLRAGPGIRLNLRNGKVFVVTIDDPETPVALLNAEVANARAG